MSPLDYALFSQLAYEEKHKELYGNFNEATFLDFADGTYAQEDNTDTGFYAVAYQKDNEVIIAYRGTDTADIVPDILHRWLGGGLSSAQPLHH